ncbi:MAG: amidohydrolase family protein [Candidatus Sumerlaeaceae bacterium]|nr:amidohydrolase family protein [Candidatus Sumerlaeaceae bacterium]
MVKFIKARAVWVDNNHLRSDAVVCVENGIVVDIISENQLPTNIASADVYHAQILLPGFINAHCHLEYSFCRGKLPRGQISFTEWIEAIGELKRSISQDELTSCAAQAIHELIAGGCTTIIDCAHRGEMRDILGASSLRHVILWELIALRDEQADEVWQWAQKNLHQDNSPMCITTGLNPHAPYSVGRRLREYLRRFAPLNPKVPVGWHVSETIEEMEYLAKGTGTFREFCQRHEIPPAFDCEPGCTPLEYLHREELLSCSHYLFHLNHFSSGDLKLLEKSPAITVVHCPTTHEFFERPPFELMTLLRRGVNVALGTDSLASADSLSMFDALRAVARTQPALTASQLLDLSTRNPARSAAIRDVKPPLGLIARGSAADFVELKTDLSFEHDLREILCHASTKVGATFVGGRKVS